MREGFEILEGVHIYRHPRPKDHEGALGYLLEYGTALLLEFFYAWWIFFRRGSTSSRLQPARQYRARRPAVQTVRRKASSITTTRASSCLKFARKDTWYQQAALERWTYRAATR